MLSTTMEKKVFLNFATCWDRAFDFQIFIKVTNLMCTFPLYVNPIHFNFCSLNDALAAPILGKSEGITVHYDGTFEVLVASI